MFFICELKKLRQLKTSLLARFRCEKKLAYLPTQLEPRIEACEELAALKVAEENLEEQRKIDAKNRKKRLRRATWIAFFLSLIAMSSLPSAVLRAHTPLRGSAPDDAFHLH